MIYKFGQNPINTLVLFKYTKVTCKNFNEFFFQVRSIVYINLRSLNIFF